MTPKPGELIIIIHILPNISLNKGNRRVTFFQLTNITREIFFFKNHTENWTETLNLGFFLFLE